MFSIPMTPLADDQNETESLVLSRSASVLSSSIADTDQEMKWNEKKIRKQSVNEDIENKILFKLNYNWKHLYFSSNVNRFGHNFGTIIIGMDGFLRENDNFLSIINVDVGINKKINESPDNYDELFINQKNDQKSEENDDSLIPSNVELSYEPPSITQTSVWFN